MDKYELVEGLLVKCYLIELLIFLLVEMKEIFKNFIF